MVGRTWGGPRESQRRELTKFGFSVGMLFELVHLHDELISFFLRWLISNNYKYRLLTS